MVMELLVTWPAPDGVIHLVAATYADYDHADSDDDLLGYLVICECELRNHISQVEYEDDILRGSRQPTCMLCIATLTG